MNGFPSESPDSRLERFSAATNWKSYWGKHIQPFMGQRVLEVGAGIGGTTQSLCVEQYREQYTEWLALEPDPPKASYLQKQQRIGKLPQWCEVVCGTIQTLKSEKQFNTILYIDVLEHVEADAEEVKRATQHLVSGGYLVVLAPAHQWLYTPFDRAMGHYRRYDRKTLLNLTTNDLACITVKYLDSVGMLASLANRLLLKTAHPSQKQIQFWDQYLVGLSRIIDPMLGYRVGKSILVVWQRL